MKSLYGPLLLMLFFLILIQKVRYIGPSDRLQLQRNSFREPAFVFSISIIPGFYNAKSVKWFSQILTTD